ncbi:MAG: DUF4395 family protein [Dermatophilaceae bacterium]
MDERFTRGDRRRLTSTFLLVALSGTSGGKAGVRSSIRRRVTSSEAPPRFIQSRIGASSLASGQTSDVLLLRDRKVPVMAPISTFEKTNLDRQGFDCLDDEDKRLYALSLRFTPFVATTSIAIGLILHSSLWLGTMALIALSGALLPRGMLIDVAYDLAVCHLFRAAPLPPTPTPRRFSYLLSTILLTGSGLSFQFDAPVVGYVLGGLVAIGGAILTITLWCLGSWIYRIILRTIPRSRHHPM